MDAAAKGRMDDFLAFLRRIRATRERDGVKPEPEQRSRTFITTEELPNPLPNSASILARTA